MKSAHLDKARRALAEKKLTRSTVKRFVESALAADSLHIRVFSRFDGMQDMVDAVKDTMRPVARTTWADSHSLGIPGLWLVDGNRNTITRCDRDGFTGLEVYNCCGCCVIAIPE
jgi:hypothetical protein